MDTKMLSRVVVIGAAAAIMGCGAQDQAGEPGPDLEIEATGEKADGIGAFDVSLTTQQPRVRYHYTCSPKSAPCRVSTKYEFSAEMERQLKPLVTEPDSDVFGSNPDKMVTFADADTDADSYPGYPMRYWVSNSTGSGYFQFFDDVDKRVPAGRYTITVTRNPALSAEQLPSLDFGMRVSVGLPCDPSNCAGCCGSDGLCYPGTTYGSCGAGGAACLTCSPGSSCQLGACTDSP